MANQKQNVVLLLERLLAPENESLLKKQEKPLLERERVKLHQEKVLEEQPEEKVLEEKPQGDLLEGEDARTFSFFLFTFNTNKWVQNKTK